MACTGRSAVIADDVSVALLLRRLDRPNVVGSDQSNMVRKEGSDVVGMDGSETTGTEESITKFVGVGRSEIEGSNDIEAVRVDKSESNGADGSSTVGMVTSENEVGIVMAVVTSALKLSDCMADSVASTVMSVDSSAPVLTAAGSDCMADDVASILAAVVS